MATPISLSPSSSAPAAQFSPAPSQNARAHLLHRQGETPSDIAAILSLPLATVDGYLGIPVSASATIPIPTQNAASAQGAFAQPVLSIFA